VEFSVVGGIGIADVTAADTLIVDNDGTAEYRSIQAAIDNASAGDTVEVRPETYTEAIIIDKNITLTAPSGATLDATNIGDSDVGVTIGNDVSDSAENVAPTIRGLTITRYDVGIESKTDSDWLISNITVQIIQDSGIDASRGDWTIRDTVVESTGGQSVITASGDWTIRNVSVENGITASFSDGDWIIRQSSVGGDILADSAEGEWVIQDTAVSGEIAASLTSDDWTIRNVSAVSIDASDSNGRWTIRQSTVQEGIDAGDADEKWEITQSIVTDSGFAAVAAEDTLGEWRISQSIINQTSSSFVIDARDALGEGIATDNWWGSPSGPDEDACVGNVDCSNSLTTRPSNVGYSPDDDESTSTPDNTTSGPTTQRTVSTTEVTSGSTVTVTVEATFSSTIDDAKLRDTIDIEETPVSADNISVIETDGGFGGLDTEGANPAVDVTYSDMLGFPVESENFTVEYEVTIPEETLVGTTIRFEGTVTNDTNGETVQIAGDTQVEIVATATSDTVSVGGQDVPVEFTSETDSGERTVETPDAIDAIDALRSEEIDVETVLDVIDAFRTSQL
jgi:hypothetical protein